MREDVAALIRGENWEIRELASRAASLEDAFVDLVQEKRGETEERKVKGL